MNISARSGRDAILVYSRCDWAPEYARDELEKHISVGYGKPEYKYLQNVVAKS